MPGKRPSVKNEKQYEALKDKGMSKERAAKIANSAGASSRGGKSVGLRCSPPRSCQGGTTAQKKAAGRKGGRRPHGSADRFTRSKVAFRRRGSFLRLRRPDGDAEVHGTEDSSLQTSFVLDDLALNVS